MNIFLKRTVQNVAIFLLLFIGAKNFIISLPLKYSHAFQGIYSRIDQNDTMFMQGRLAFAVSVVMILLAYNLYRRLRSAWVGEIIVLIASIILQAVYYHTYALHMIILESLVLIVLLLSMNDFSRLPKKGSVKKALLYIVLSFLLLFLNTTFAIYLIRGDMDNLKTLSGAFVKSIQLMGHMDKSVLAIHSSLMNIYADSLIALYWFFLLSALIMVLKPLTYDYLKNKSEKDRVLSLVMKHGRNPLAYLAMEDDKYYFFGTDVEGVCAYTVVGNVMVICGDPICGADDSALFLGELLAFCRQNSYDPIALNITGDNLDLLRENHFGIMKYGEDACFRLDEYNLKGGKVAKVRAAINHADKAGIRVYEYKPAKVRNGAIEKSIQGISRQWMAGKNMPEMKFMVGGTGLDSPGERRYFYAVDDSGSMEGFVVFLPYSGGKAYMADVTRRRSDAPQGVIEKIIYEAFTVMKEEGVEIGNMGLSPLYNISAGGSESLSEKILGYIYENLKNVYDFKSLHHSKEKYAPSHWEPRYIAFYPRPMSFKFAYAIVKAQNPGKLTDMIRSQLKKPK